jgi:nickel transport protein
MRESVSEEWCGREKWKVKSEKCKVEIGRSISIVHFSLFTLHFSLLWGAISPPPALAHRINVTAPVQGTTIAGEAYFVDGSPARNASVTVLDPAGKTIGQTTTDADGRFSFPLRFRCDHRVVVDAGDGHAKTVTVSASEMPGTLPVWNGAPAPSDKAPPAPALTETAAAEDAQLTALQGQIAELRKEVARYENKVRLSDVLGGIGCILGFMGLAFYFLGVRRREKAECRKTNVEGTSQ